LGEIQIVGVTGRDRLYDCLDGYLFIPMNMIDSANFDYIAVTSETYFKEIVNEAKSIGIPEDRLFMAKVFLLPGFHMDKYISLLKSNISIIANNCWGGMMYNALGMRFNSPFINMREEQEDFVRLLSNLDYYLKQELKLVKYSHNSTENIEYPICRLDDVELNFIHYKSLRLAEEKWYTRIRRVNFDNLFIMMFTDNRKILEEFDKLDYEKKICFVPFDSPLKSAFKLQIAGRNEMNDVPLSEIVINIARGWCHDYDLIELLTTGKINHNRYYKKEVL
jgi:uncharacterized protein (DUF1919 family)